MSSFVKPKHLNLYKKYITQLITDLGSQVILHYEDSSTQCPNCIYDTVHKCSSGKFKTGGPRTFTSGSICPVCGGKGVIVVNTERSITCTVNWGDGKAPKEQLDEVPAGVLEKNMFYIKTVVVNYDYIKSAKYMTIDGIRAKMLSIFKRGLKENVVCVAICQRDD